MSDYLHSIYAPFSIGKEGEVLEMSKRSYNQSIINRLLLLYLCSISKEHGIWLGITKLQKLSFLSEKTMVDNRMNGLSYLFFRFNYGPMSKEIYQDRDNLINAGLLKKGKGDHAPLNKAKSLLEDFLKDHYEENQTFFEGIKSIVRENRNYSTEELSEKIYEMKIKPPLFFDEPKKIRDIPLGYDLLDGIAPENADQKFRIDQAWLETLNLEFSLSKERKQAMKISASPTFQEQLRKEVEEVVV